MNMDHSSIPDFCPEGYYGHYTLASGDSIALLANLFSISEEDLLRANPHITSTQTMPSGTKIHIPGLIPFPAGIMFALAEKELPFANGGGAFIHLSPEGGQSVSVIATLPASSYFGAYDLYLVEVMVTANNIFEGQLFATPDDPPSWAARIDLPFLTSLSPDSRIVIRPFNSSSGMSGEIILAIDFSNLPTLDCTNAHEDLSITSEEMPAEYENNMLNEEAEVFDDIAVISEPNEEDLPTLDLPITEDNPKERSITDAKEEYPPPEDLVEGILIENDVPTESVIATEEESTFETEALAEEASSDLEADADTEDLLAPDNQEIDTNPHEEELPGETAEPEEEKEQPETKTQAAEEESPIDAGNQEHFEAEQILASHRITADTLPRFKSASYVNNKRRPINLLLTAAVDGESAVGIASVQLQPSQVIISALKLPDPSRLGPQYKYYKAWLIDAGNNQTAVFEMKKVLNGVWAGRSSSTALKAFDLVLITAESSPNVTKPVGPEILIGILSDDI